MTAHRCATAFLLAIGLAIAPRLAAAQDYGAGGTGGITIPDAWTTATKKAGTDAPAYMTIRNTSATADRLSGVACPIAAETDLFDATGSLATAGIALPAKSTVKLAPGGAHVLLRNPAFNLKAGAKVPCAITFASGGQMELMLTVRPAAAK